MNIIVPSSTTPQNENISPKQEVVIENAGSAIEESLSEVPLTTDQKIAQLLDTQAKLTAEIHNLTNGLNQLIDLSKMMMKSHIENVNTMDDLKQYLKQSINILYNKVERIKDPLIKEISEQSNKIVTAQEAINKKILDRQTVLAGALTFMVRGLKSHEVIDHDYKQSAINQLTKI